MHWLVSIELTLSIKPFQYLEAKLKLHKSVRFRLPLLIPQEIQSQDTERKKQKQTQHLIVDSNSLHSLLRWFLFDVKQYQRALFFFCYKENVQYSPRKTLSHHAFEEKYNNGFQLWDSKCQKLNQIWQGGGIYIYLNHTDIML